MQYEIRALSSNHVMTQLTVTALDPADARRQVEARGLFAASITPIAPSIFRAWRSPASITLPLVLFSQELLALLNAGLGIVECLEALLEKESAPAIRTIFEQLLTGLRDGKRFSSVLAERSDQFPALYIGIIRAAEGTSDLPRSLARFIDYQQRIDSVRSKVVSAAVYPCILLLVGGIVTGFLIGYVVPRFAEVYKGAARELPWLSQRLLDWGQFVAAHGLIVFSACAIGVVAVAVALRHFLAQGGITRLIARLPGIGERARIYELSRLYLTLGMLLEGGIPIIAAMETVRSIVNSELQLGLRTAIETIQSGAQLSTAFEANHLTTPVSLRMLRVGERSGELGKMLTQSAAFYDGEISRWIDRFTRTFEPLLMVAIGLIVGTIVVLLYMPIFDLAESLS